MLNRRALSDKAIAQQSDYLGTFGFKPIDEYLAIRDRIRQGPDAVAPQVAMQALLDSSNGWARSSTAVAWTCTPKPPRPRAAETDSRFESGHHARLRRARIHLDLPRPVLLVI